ncbi:MAG: response regulator [Candidatus Omnitrophica bacterium]|nr:response regulator [Candidatus Omnitrophota bacterium]
MYNLRESKGRVFMGSCPLVKKKILVIDDEEGFTEMVKEALEQTGQYKVDIENNAARVLDTVRKVQPDLILLDVLLPYMDGPHIAELIRRDNSSGDIPIVYVSGLFDFVAEDEKPGLMLLSKPLQVKKLIRCVEKNI